MSNGRGKETRVLTTVGGVFLVLGLGSLVLFLLDPDIHAHPQLVLLAGTGLLGALMLKALSVVLEPTSDLD